jgi:arylsulfatase A-like enzyme
MPLRPSAAALSLLLAAAPSAALGSGLESVHDAKNQDLTPSDAPNVVFILADDLGYAEVGAYGQRKIRTPSIDRLAAEGLRFTRHYAGNAVCAPSRSVLMTGLHPGHTPIRDNREVQPEGQWPLPAAAETVAERLKARGYVTGAAGKWGLGPPGSEGDPLKQGFDHFFGYNCQRHAHNHYPAYLYDDGRRVTLRNAAFSPHQELPAGTDAADPRTYVAFAGQEYAPDLVWEKARGFVRANRARPFFLFVPTTVPHLALQVPEDSLEEYRGLFAETPYRGEKQYLPTPSPRAAYAAMVTRMDREVGRTLALLRELGLDERTLVVFTSDNGATFDVGGADSQFFDSAAGLRGRKGSLYEGGVRVPLIVRWPGRVAPGTVSDRVTGFEDWLPTLVALAGGEAPAGIDGISFADTLLGRPQEPRPFLYREFPGYGGQQSVLAGSWKAVRQGLDRKASAPPRTELYDLAGDPGETKDVAAAHPQVVARLEALLEREHARSALFPIAAIDGPEPGYSAVRSAADKYELLRAGDAPWAPAQSATWGPAALATSFRALWNADGLLVRFDVTDPAPWHTMTRRDDEIWNEEVVELFLDVGSTGREYAELEISPANVVVDLWVEPGARRYDKSWDIAGLETRVVPRADAAGNAIGWIGTAFVPWSALRGKAPAKTALPPQPGDRWRFNVYRIERPNGPGEPARDPVLLPWAPTGQRTFHVPQAFRELVFEGGPGARPAAPSPR